MTNLSQRVLRPIPCTVQTPVVASNCFQIPYTWIYVLTSLHHLCISYIGCLVGETIDESSQASLLQNQLQGYHHMRASSPQRTWPRNTQLVIRHTHTHTTWEVSHSFGVSTCWPPAKRMDCVSLPCSCSVGVSRCGSGSRAPYLEVKVIILCWQVEPLYSM